MTDVLTLEAVDTDGAIQEAADRVSGDSRAGFFRKGFLVAGGTLGASALVGAADARAQTSTDVAILQFAHALEHLEAEFYAEALRMGALRGDVLAFARVVAAHERTHVKFLSGALGSSAIKKPRFNFRGTTESQSRFVATAIVLEDTGVKAYKGQAPRIQTDSILAAALSVHSVEARHAAWIRHIAGKPPAPTAFDPAASLKQVLAAVKGTRFLAGPIRTVSGGAPLFTG
ncbi:MAG: ferritin-like domain-containing protein [Actinobacteria bacterium]|nr:ferritin-like domain-containing protein [Actinomycetota bacterium]